MNISFKNILPHIVAIAAFLIITCTYFTPLLEGKKIKMDDIIRYKGMSKEIFDYREKTGKEALWTNSMFGGMPAYFISVQYPGNLIKYVDNILKLNLDYPACVLFVSMLGFYILLLVFKVDPWLSIAGAIAYAFSSYFFIIIEAGHTTKSVALAYMPGIIAGIYLAFNRKLLFGSILAGIFLALQLRVNHLQITYYTLIIILIFGAIQLISSIKEKTYKKLLKTLGVLCIAVIFAIGSNFASMFLVYEYGKVSIRGKSELTFDKEIKTSGLDKDYATAWSYGIDETFTLLIPNFKGGASGGELGTDSETYKVLNQNNVPNSRNIIKQLPLYWGAQPFTSGPVYVGAIVFFLFILGLFLIKGPTKWWLLSAAILSIILAWGKNFMFFTDIFLDYVPAYNKFRTVSMILIIAEFAMPLLAILTLKKIIDNNISKQEFYSAFKKAFIIVGGVSLLFALLPGMFFDFTAQQDNQLIAGGWPDFLIQALRDDRKSLLRADAFRSLVFIILASALLLAFINKKLSKNTVYIALIGLFLVDMWPINRRYLNNENFVSKKEIKTPYKPTQADLQILQDTDPNFRVLNLSVNTFNDASTSYFHKSIGGYHGAKMRRYQELIEFHISKNNINVLNMLNTKYFIIRSPEDNRPLAQRNPDSQGNAWFVKDYILVNNANEEIIGLINPYKVKEIMPLYKEKLKKENELEKIYQLKERDEKIQKKISDLSKAITQLDSKINGLAGFNSKEIAVIDKRFEKHLERFANKTDSTAIIKLTEYKPNHLTYQSQTNSNQLAVFSEIYYDKGWNAYVDGELTPHFRSNYVLRAMLVPEGRHKIEFKFEPKAYKLGNNISLVSSAILILLFIGVVFRELMDKNRH